MTSGSNRYTTARAHKFVLISRIALVIQITLPGERAYIFAGRIRPSVARLTHVRANQTRTRPLGPKPGTTVARSHPSRRRAPFVSRNVLIAHCE